MSNIVWTYVDHLDADGKVQFFQRGVPWKRLDLPQILGPHRPHTWQAFKAFAAMMGTWAPVDSDAEMLALQTRPQHEPAACEDAGDDHIRLLKVCLKNAVEPKRPPLPGYGQRTPFDPFRDFQVSSDCAVESQPDGAFLGVRLDGCGEFKAPRAI